MRIRFGHNSRTEGALPGEVKMSVTVSKAVNEAVKKAAKEDRRSASGYIGKLIETHLSQLKDAKP